jgi:hypothetical protein
MADEERREETPVELPKGKWFDEWRGMAAWLYLIIVTFDFLVGPLFFGWYSFLVKAQLVQNWTPLTLGGGGLFHIAFASIIGITAWKTPR